MSKNSTQQLEPESLHFYVSPTIIAHHLNLIITTVVVRTTPHHRLQQQLLPAAAATTKEDPVGDKNKMLQAFCSTADYKKKCKDTLSKVVSKSATMIIKAAISAASDELGKATKDIDQKLKFEKPDEKAAYEDCKKLFEDAKEELKDSIALPMLRGL
ncbi:hypothetical protein Dimus_025854 [Dionaea muscipula]